MFTQRRQRDQQRMTPQGPTDTYAQTEDVKGGQTDAGNNERSRHAAWGSETSGGGWGVKSGGEFQVENVTLRDRMWGVGDIKREVRRR